jgi:hypothetical protein
VEIAVKEIDQEVEATVWNVVGRGLSEVSEVRVWIMENGEVQMGAQYESKEVQVVIVKDEEVRVEMIEDDEVQVGTE